MAITRISKSALLPYPAEALFDLINDIEAYPQYMDGCVGATVLSRTDNVLEGRLDLNRAGISQSFATRNTLIRPERIKMELLEGPFQSLNGEWRFNALAADACKVVLELAFEMDGSLANLAAAKLFESVASGQVDALCKRAHQRLGQRT